MKSKTVNSILLLILVVSIPLFFLYFKPALLQSSLFTDLFPPQSEKMWSVFRGQIVRLVHLCAVFGVISIFGYQYSNLFLVKGNISLGAEKFPLFGIKGGEPWWKIALNVGSVVVGVTIIFCFLTLKLTSRTLHETLQQMPLILMNAAMNAFYEEFVFRAALIPPLLMIVGKSKTIWITAILFGIAHFHGNELSGVLFALMATYLGLLLAKSMIETKGILFAWGLHFILDVVVFSSMVIAS